LDESGSVIDLQTLPIQAVAAHQMKVHFLYTGLTFAG
jgi:hypothetical protein